MRDSGGSGYGRVINAVTGGIRASPTVSGSVRHVGELAPVEVRKCLSEGWDHLASVEPGFLAGRPDGVMRESSLG